MFAYCLNNPIAYCDYTGNLASGAKSSAFYLHNDDYLGCGGGVVVTSYFLDAFSDTISNARDWVDEQEQAIREKLSRSLQKASWREYRTEYEEHHLVARKSPNAAAAAAILNGTLPGGVEDPLNKVLVKTSVHRRIHTTLYYMLANSIVIGAYLQAGGDKHQQYANVVAALGGLRVFVESLNVLAIN